MAPHAFTRSCLFRAASGEDENGRPYLSRWEVPAWPGMNLTYTGPELRQEELDIHLAIIHYFRGAEIDESCPLPIPAYQLLKDMQWHHGGAEYRRLKEGLDRLQRASLQFETSDGENTIQFQCSLVDKFQVVTSKNNHRSGFLWIWMDPRIASLFDSSEASLILWKQRISLGRHVLAKWMLSFLYSHKYPKPYPVERYWDLSGSRAKTRKGFRQTLKKALDALIEIGFLENYTIDKDGYVYVVRSHASKRMQDNANSPSRIIQQTTDKLTAHQR